MDGEYAEVFAGGGAVALSLLYGEYARAIHINDLDPGVHAFWVAARDQTSRICKLIQEAKLTPDEWDRQREIQMSADPDPLELGFSTFYLNRTNRSGIVTGGVIGGKGQMGAWKIDARFNKDDLISRIQRIGRWRSRINVYGLDAAEFLATVAQSLPRKSLLYLDPPYFVKGQEMLYANYYEPDDHGTIARAIQALDRKWFVSYDDAPEIRELYRARRALDYGIAYSAAGRYRGREVVFFSDDLTVPMTTDPTQVTPEDLSTWRASI